MLEKYLAKREYEISGGILNDLTYAQGRFSHAVRLCDMYHNLMFAHICFHISHAIYILESAER